LRFPKTILEEAQIDVGEEVNVSVQVGQALQAGELPYKPFDLESLALDLETEMLEAERFTPADNLGIPGIPGVHNQIQPKTNSPQLIRRDKLNSRIIF
jgi:antitoxin component of MazEF toxin-antitoxin module